MEGDGAAARLPRWIREWDRRPFFFSSALDPLVGLAALNLATHVHLQRRGRSGATAATTAAPPASLASAPRSLRLVDPCVGSGTILAAAAARGFERLAGADINEDFLVHTAANLRTTGLRDGRRRPAARLRVHDATAPFPPELLERDQLPDTLVVSNPPWGANIGREADGAAIVSSVTAQFAGGGATLCWIANPRAVEALRCMAGVALLRHVRFGSMELVVVCAADAPDVAGRRN